MSSRLEFFSPLNLELSMTTDFHFPFKCVCSEKLFSFFFNAASDKPVLNRFFDDKKQTNNYIPCYIHALRVSLLGYQVASITAGISDDAASSLILTSDMKLSYGRHKAAQIIYFPNPCQEGFRASGCTTKKKKSSQC